jgi:YfiH family protein
MRHARTRWRMEGTGGFAVARSAILDEVVGIGHLVTTRQAPSEPDRILGAARLAGPSLALVRQVHGARVVDAADARTGTVEADGIALGRAAYGRDPIPAVRTADCVPVLLAARDGSAVAAVHAGWRGVASGVVTEAVHHLGAYGARPSDLAVALGPAIGPCCYEVGEEVVAAVVATGPPRDAIVRENGVDRPHLDLHAAIRLQLERAGVDGAAIDAAPWCTRCRNDLFFSARAEPKRIGRLVAAIGPLAPVP